MTIREVDTLYFTSTHQIVVSNFKHTLTTILFMLFRQQILREAKEKTEEAEKNLKIMHKQQYKKQLHFETLFDDYHGKNLVPSFVLPC